MCLAAFAINVSSRWPLVIASNRDEFLNRPSLPLASWQSASGQQIISGRDVLAGGTWLGLTPAGRLALLTNVREMPQAGEAPAPKSRGELVMRWLEGDMNAEQFMAQTDCAAYGGFNLMLGDFQSGIHSSINSEIRLGNWTWLSNRSFDANAPGAAAHRPQRVNWKSRALAPGIYGLSNAALDTPWPKTAALKAALAHAMTQPRARLEAQLLAALDSRERHGRQGLPDTGLPLEVEDMLSSAFVDDATRGYGTRCSTVLIAEATENTGKTPEQADFGGWNLRIEEKTPVRSNPGPRTPQYTSSVIHQRWPVDTRS